MNELSRMSRDELVSELVAPVCAVSDATMAYCAADDTPASQAEIARRLAIAREILLRDLEAECRRTAVLDSPKTVREYLMLHYAHLPHEVFGVHDERSTPTAERGLAQTEDRVVPRLTGNPVVLTRAKVQS
jgi:hypothetical protein